MTSKTRARRRAGWSLLPLLAAGIAYAPILRAYFVADDFRSFLVIADHGPMAFVFEQFGSHALVVRNALWVLWYRLFGLAAEPFMWTVLLTHLLNVWLLWLTLDRLSGRPALAALGSAWWGTSPLHVESLGWYSVYGHVLVGTFLLAVLAHASALLERRRLVTFPMAVGWIGLLALAANSFGIGVAAAIVVPLALLVCLPAGRNASRAARLLLLGAPLWAAIDYFAVARVGARVAPSMDILALVQPWRNLGALADQGRMLASLLRVGLGGLLTGHLVRFDPWSPDLALLVPYGVVCLAALAITGAGARRADPSTRRWILAPLGAGIALYAVVAIGRGGLCRIFHLTPEAAGFSSRYHYAPTLLVTVAFVLALAELVRPKGHRTLVPLVALAAMLQIGGWWWWGGLAIPSHSEARAFVGQATRRIAALVQDAPPATEVHIGNVPAPPKILGLLDAAAFPGWAGVYVITQPTDEVAAHRVVFAEPSRSTRNAHPAPASRRLSRLLVRPPLHLGETCELSAALHALDLGRTLLACPLRTPAADACTNSVRRRWTATAGRRCSCVDPRTLADRISRLAIVTRAALSCPAATANTDDACPHHVLRRLGLFASALGACHRDAVLSHRGLADAACVERATTRYDRHVSALDQRCAVCVDLHAFEPAVRTVVDDLMDDALCKTIQPGVATYVPVGPTATRTPAPAGHPADRAG